MFKWLDKRRQRQDVATKLYNDLVSHARNPAFYLSFGVPDSELGRFEMVCLHSYLLFRRLGRTDIPGKDLAQSVHDLMFADLDRTLREQGIGDMGIGKRVKKLARNLYGRIDAYETGFAGGTDELADALRRNLYAYVEPSDDEMSAMIGYINGAIVGLDGQPTSEIMAGNVAFPQVVAGSEVHR
ncbi:MAG: phage tail protein [Alphaproteobacteria bacterium]|nr:phage tail protein [Alphaproteobacteria bacterium]